MFTPPLSPTGQTSVAVKTDTTVKLSLDDYNNRYKDSASTLTRTIQDVITCIDIRITEFKVSDTLEGKVVHYCSVIVHNRDFSFYERLVAKLIAITHCQNVLSTVVPDIKSFTYDHAFKLEKP